MKIDGPVYVVDDDDAVRDSLALLLEAAGLRVEAFAGAADALARCRDERPACVVTDVRMPDIDGLELQRRLAQLHARLAVIVITGHGDVPLAVQAMKAGAVDFIEKPFSNQQLLDSIRRALAIDQVAREARARRAAAIARLRALSTREQEVADLVVEGNSNKQIAAELALSIKTVEFHRSHIMRKMGADSLAALIHVVLIAKGLREP